MVVGQFDVAAKNRELGYQAIVGNVNALTEGVGASEKSGEQPHALGYAPGITLPREIEAERVASSCVVRWQVLDQLHHPPPQFLDARGATATISNSHCGGGIEASGRERSHRVAAQGPRGPILFDVGQPESGSSTLSRT
jgi:hypothetical protein